MFKELGSIASMIRQAQTMGPKMQELAEQLKSKQVEGSAGGGMVTVIANGAGQILKIEIDPAIEEKNDFEMAKDLLPAAINQALDKAKQLHMESMQAVTGDFSLPPNMEKMLNGILGGEQTDEPEQP